MRSDASVTASAGAIEQRGMIARSFTRRARVTGPDVPSCQFNGGQLFCTGRYFVPVSTRVCGILSRTANLMRNFVLARSLLQPK